MLVIQCSVSFYYNRKDETGRAARRLIKASCRLKMIRFLPYQSYSTFGISYDPKVPQVRGSFNSQTVKKNKDR